MAKCYIIAASGGAIGGYFMALAGQLAAQGHRVILLHDGITLPPAEGVHLMQWPSQRPTRLRDGLFFWRLLRSEKPHAIIASFGAVTWAMLVGWLARVPLRIAWRHTLIGQIRMDAPPSGLAMLRKGLILRLATHLVANTAFTLADTRRRFRLNRKPGMVLPYLLPDRPVERAPEARLVVCAARLARSKGIDVLIRAARLADARLVVLGEGPQRPALQALADELDADCTFMGRVSPGEVHQWMSKAAVVVVPSREEAFGLVAVEAMRAAAPLIATFAGGLPEVVGEGGILLDENNTYEMAERLRELLTYPERAEALGARGRVRYEARYQLSTHIAEHAARLTAL